jgi:hypothetical protein
MLIPETGQLPIRHPTEHLAQWKVQKGEIYCQHETYLFKPVDPTVP